MIKPYVITLTQVKDYTGIADTSYDTQINTFIPDVTDDLTRKNGICNQSFLATGIATASESVTLSDVVIAWDNLYIGSCIYINGEDGVISAYDEDAQTITLESALTSSGDYDLTVRNFPSGAKQTVAKMVMYRVGVTNTNTDLAVQTASETIGPVSVSYSVDEGTLDKFGYPSSLTKALRTIRKPRFF